MRVLMKADLSRRESLLAEAEVDPMDGEQTWPTDTELQEAEGTETASRYITDFLVKREIPYNIQKENIKEL